VTEHLRVVLDTNVIVSAFLSRNPTSPTQEIIRRWQADEFTLLVSDAIVDELAEKLIDKGIGQERVIEFLMLLVDLAEWVPVPDEDVTRRVLADPDDDHLVACALVGQADYLVTYDPHFDSLLGTHQGLQITKALPFLWAVRGDVPPASNSQEVTI
jgi:putative PIN family toxin of toxin-antitoxin system